MGISKSYLKELAEKKKYQSGGFSTEDKQFSVKKSTIPGANKGLFSKTPIKQGKLIGLAHENNQPVGTLGNMHNHSETPNMQSVKVGNQRYVYATRDIQPGEELTTNYRLQPELEQPEDFMGNERFGQMGFQNPSEAFLKNWVEKRKIRDSYIQEAYSIDQPELIKRAQNFPSVVTVPNIDNNPNITGRYESTTGKVLRTPTAPPHVVTHEQTHYLQDFPNYMRTVHQNIVGNELKPVEQQQGIYKEKYPYFSDPDEVHSRIMVLREKAGFKPNKQVTEKNLNKFLKGYKGDVDNINDLLEISKDKKALLNMLNYMAVNEKPTEYYGQKGLYKPDFRTKSQIAADYGNTGESTKVAPKINPVSKRLIDEANYERLKNQQPSFNQGYKKTASDIERSDYYRKQQELKNALKGVDVVTDVMQYGNFIPHPAAQVIGKVGNILGAATDVTQAGMDYGNENYGGMAINLASAAVPTFLGAASFRRNSKYLRPGQPLYPFSPQAGILPGGYSRVSYIEPFNMVKGMTKNNLMANRALLGTLAAETDYDAGVFDNPNNIKLGLPINRQKPQYQTGGTMLAEPDYDIYKAPKQGNYLLPDINRPYYTDEQGGNRSEYKMGFNINGKETLLPTVVGGRQLTPEEAINRYYQTGLHMGQYNTPEEAEYAARLRTAKYNMLQDPVRFNASMFQMGGTMGIPGVNGQVVSSGPTPLTSVKKTRGPMSKNSKGDIKTMSPKAVKQTLKYSKQKPNKI
jgi:SET domain